MATITRPFPDMPVDILREILDFAASDDIHCALNLTLVSSYTRQWALPILYSDVRLSSSRAVTSFLSSISPSSGASTLAPRAPLHSRVKSLGIFALGPLEHIRTILDTCTAVQNLACGFTSPQLSPSPAREQHFIGAACRDGIPFAAIPMTTTHLHVQLSVDVVSSLESVLDELPELTHLAVSIPMTSVKSLGLAGVTVLPAVQAVLNNGLGLKALHLQFMGSKGGELVETMQEWTKNDSRVFVSKGPASLSRQWVETRIWN